ncbi:MAG: glucose-6-phosphate isomerase [Phycisphaeraceae bacterium]|nr:glucose-6-phosphate isomerase [Phycisphaeraceae bacterium]
MDSLSRWRRFKDTYCDTGALGIGLDIARMNFDDGFFKRLEPALTAAFSAMNGLEAGETANIDENRMVGHYWLRQPDLAPSDEITGQIVETRERIRTFAADVHEKRIVPPEAPRFTDLLIVGIGGSALGPQLIADALGTRRDKMVLHFLDNTDPDGFDRTIAALGTRLKSTLVLVVSKSGGTAETRNGMIEVRQAMTAKKLNFARQAVAITMAGSALDQQAESEGWLDRFPMWDFVGGRTSVFSAVGLLPAALQGLDIDEMLEGALAMDELTRKPDVKRNPAARVALMWHYAGEGRGRRDMVVLPYKDRLLLLSRYLQQLIMESLGKEKDLDGQVVEQGLTVFGNKGSTDQHAYVQQLRDGLDNFFVNFIVCLEDRSPVAARTAPEVEPGITSGDYLLGFWLGTREALSEKNRQSITIVLNKLDGKHLGALIALYERAVGLYASMININAYHQPGVEAGKKAAARVLELQGRLVEYLKANPAPATPEQIADRMEASGDVEMIYNLLRHLAANKRGVGKTGNKFRWKG